MVTSLDGAGLTARMPTSTQFSGWIFGEKSKILPSSVGGYLETTRDIVSDTIRMNLAAGMTVGQAQNLYALGNTAYAAHDWKGAYTQYRAAYQQAVAKP